MLCFVLEVCIPLLALVMHVVLCVGSVYTSSHACICFVLKVCNFECYVRCALCGQCVPGDVFRGWIHSFVGTASSGQ